MNSLLLLIYGGRDLRRYHNLNLYSDQMLKTQVL